MRLLVYNVRYGTGSGWRFHLPIPFAGFFRRTDRHFREIQRYIQSQDPDVIGLVEVDTGSYRSRRTCQATFLARCLGHRATCRPKYADDSIAAKVPILRRQANACLSDGATQSARYHFFRHGVKRLVIELRLEEISVFLVHLALSKRTRRKQLRELETMIRRSGRPCIVAGDFNAFAGLEELNGFMRALNLSSANSANEPTFPSAFPRWQVDYILHSPEIHISNFHVARDVQLSDHLPLVCDFELAASA